jgi:hypothetical protein
MQGRIDRAAHIILGPLGGGIYHPGWLWLCQFSTLNWNRWQCLLLQHCIEITTRLWSNCWWWSSRFLGFFHVQSPLLDRLSRSSFLCVCHSSGTLSLALHLALSLGFLSTLLLFLAAFFFLDSSTLSLNL